MKTSCVFKQNVFQQSRHLYQDESVKVYSSIPGKLSHGPISECYNYTSKTKLKQEKMSTPKRRKLDGTLTSLRGTTEEVILNVGGTRFSTSLTTLTSTPGTYFSARFGTFGNYREEMNSDYFIDRDATYFRHVLNWLRSRVVPHTLTSGEVKELLVELEYFSLFDFSESLKGQTKKEKPQQPRTKMVHGSSWLQFKGQVLRLEKSSGFRLSQALALDHGEVLGTMKHWSAIV